MKDNILCSKLGRKYLKIMILTVTKRSMKYNIQNAVCKYEENMRQREEFGLEERWHVSRILHADGCLKKLQSIFQSK